MDWLIMIIGFGLGALACFIGSLVLAHQKRYAVGLTLGALELISAAISSLNWADALRASGKTDWFVFGLLGYTPIGLICISMFAAGVLCLVLNTRGLSKQPDVRKGITD